MLKFVEDFPHRRRGATPRRGVSVVEKPIVRVSDRPNPRDRARVARRPFARAGGNHRPVRKPSSWRQPRAARLFRRLPVRRRPDGALSLPGGLGGAPARKGIPPRREPLARSRDAFGAGGTAQSGSGPDLRPALHLSVALLLGFSSGT